MINYDELIKKTVNNELNSPEYDMKKCKICGEIKKRIIVGQFKSVNRKYQDENGRLWNGRTCADCHKKKMKSHMREKRSK